MEKFVAFLRGINVGGHHKVPMVELKELLDKMGFTNISTLLNSGNIVFDSKEPDTLKIEDTLSKQLEDHFGFSIPTMIRMGSSIQDLAAQEPFKDIKLTKDIRLYVSFLKEEKESELQLPYTSEDSSFKILRLKDLCICSVLDIAIGKTPKAMGILEKEYGKDITTRNWNTIIKINKLL